jgi:ArsR family transcriptional regulator
MDKTIRILKALSDPTRLRIVLALSVKPCCVCELSAALDLPQPTVSRCLRVLRDANVVVTARSGRWVDYELNGGNSLVQAIVSSATDTLEKNPLYREDKKRVQKADRIKICK